MIQRVQADEVFAQALLDEAATLFLNGEPETARLFLRDLVKATIGFEQLATLTAKPSKSLHRMLSSTGNPSMDNLRLHARDGGNLLGTPSVTLRAPASSLEPWDLFSSCGLEFRFW